MPPIAAPAIQTATPLPCGRHRPWHCVWTKPSQEFRARDALENDGFPTFLPLDRPTKPLFERYLFAQPNDDGQWIAMRYAAGVTSLLTNGIGMPRLVPVAVMAYLTARCDENGVYLKPVPRQIQKGDTITVPSGPFADHLGICTRTAAKRVWLLLDLMNRKIEVPFAREALEV
jgi:transcription antitermination factor NusG